jgi:enterobactin synthetase component D
MPPGAIEPPLLRAWNGDAIALHLLPLGLGSYTVHEFARHDIPMPEAIARSVPKRQAEYLAGRLAARQALTPFGLGHVHIGTGTAREPLWPAGILGSISHNRHLAAAVAVDTAVHGAIGIDVESMVEAHMQAALTSLAISPQEMAVLERACPTLPMEWLMTVVFSAKESFFKAAFPAVGRYFDFDAIALRTFDWLAHTLTFEIREALCPALMPGRLVQARYVKLDADTVCTYVGWGR